MVKAINKEGMVSEFTDLVWELMSPHKNGFVELREGATNTTIPNEIIEFHAKKAEQKMPPEEIMEVHVIKQKNDAAADVDIMREFLKEKGIKVHHLAGYDKVKALYDENKE